MAGFSCISPAPARSMNLSSIWYWKWTGARARSCAITRCCSTHPCCAPPPRPAPPWRSFLRRRLLQHVPCLPPPQCCPRPQSLLLLHPLQSVLRPRKHLQQPLQPYHRPVRSNRQRHPVQRYPARQRRLPQYLAQQRPSAASPCVQAIPLECWLRNIYPVGSHWIRCSSRWCVPTRRPLLPGTSTVSKLEQCSVCHPMQTLKSSLRQRHAASSQHIAKISPNTGAISPPMPQSRRQRGHASRFKARCKSPSRTTSPQPNRQTA